jgi:hypothetical protein
LVQLTTTDVRRFQFGRDIIESDVVATIDDLPLAHCRASNVTMARADAVNELMRFLMNLVNQFDQNQELNRRDLRAAATQSVAESAEAIAKLAWKSEPPQPQIHRVDSPEHMDIDDESFDDSHEPAASNSRKRRYEHSAQHDEVPSDRDPVRRRVDSDASVHSEVPTFFVDDVGERPREPAPRPDVVMKQRAEAYQELLTLLFQDEAAVVSQLREVDWKDEDEAVFNFSRKIQVGFPSLHPRVIGLVVTFLGVAAVFR